jgi:ribonuclease T1
MLKRVRGGRFVLTSVLFALLPLPFSTWSRGAPDPLAYERAAEIAASDLPGEARATIRLIRAGGPFPYDRDGAIFGNFERQLPARERGYYREYTVRTPGIKHRGARRIVAGRGGELFYTDDHYRSFSRVRE